MVEFSKCSPGAPRGYFACEAAGLEWLTVSGGVRCARVIAFDDSSLTLERLEEVPPTPDDARAFGRQLAVTHGAGAPGYGAAPAGWTGPGFFGPLQHPMPMSLTACDTWGEFYAQQRLTPMLLRAIDRLDRPGAAAVQRVIKRCEAGDFDDGDAPARLHGDLWAGNVMWTRQGATLIDPAAHGGHRETDLAMLALFGIQHLEAIYEGYQSVHQLVPGWRERTGLHQLYPLLAHVALFGDSYADQVRQAATSALS